MLFVNFVKADVLFYNNDKSADSAARCLNQAAEAPQMSRAAASVQPLLTAYYSADSASAGSGVLLCR